MDYAGFIAPRITKREIWEKADAFRKNFCPEVSMSVPIMEIVECDLDILIQPIRNLRSDYDVDALLLSDLKTLIVDEGDFMDDRMQNRIRFSMAHEVGHLELHSDLYAQFKHNNVAEWIDFQQKIPEDQWRWIEIHANEFAGRLLVPSDMLDKKVQDAKKAAENAGFTEWDNSKDEAIEYIASHICRQFQVSSDVIERRIRHEDLY